MIGWAIQAENVNWNAKKWKRPPKSSKNKMFIFGLCSACDDGPSWSMDLKPICSPLQPIKCNAQFWITFNFCWLAGLVDGLEPHLPPISSQKNEMLIFGLHSTSDDRPSDLSKKRWPKHKKNRKGLLSHWKIKCSFLDYVQLLMISRAIRAKNINQKTKKPQKCPLSHRKIKCLFLDYIQLLMIGRTIQAKNVNRNVKKWKRPPKSSKNKMFVFVLRSTSDDWMSDPSKKCWPKCKKNPKKAP